MEHFYHETIIIGERSELSSVADGDFVMIYIHVPAGTSTLDTRVWLTSEAT